jgi:uncharacterized protein YigE (DUF2233 family)
MTLKSSIIAISIVFLGAGCLPIKTLTGSNNAVPEKTGWQAAGTGVFRYECAPPACAARIVIYRFPKTGFSWRFQNSAAPLTVEGHLASDPKAVFAVNGVYFDEKFAPAGWMISGGTTIGDKKYEYSKSAILELAPEFKIIDTAKEKFAAKNIAEAAQSYPLLIANGAVQKVANEKTARRTFAGADKQGNVYFGIIPDDDVTLAGAAELINKTDADWDDVLNLDGGPSSGLVSNLPASKEELNSIVQVPNAIVAEIE